MRHHSMLRWLEQSVVAGAACLAGGFACAQEAPTPAPPTEQIARWVQELDSDSYAVRERASKHLLEAGPSAVERLSQAVADPSIEVSTRAGSILQRIASANDEGTLNQISAALQKLSSKRPAIRAMVADILTQQKKFKHTRAVAQVRALGGGLSGNWEGEAVHHAEAMILAPPLAIDELEVAPAIALEAIEVPDFEGPAIVPPVIEDPAPPKRGILGLLERLIVPAAVPDFVPPSDAPVPVEAPDAVPLAPVPLPLPVEAVPRFDAIPALPEIPEVELPIPAEAIPAVEDIAIAEIELAEPAFAPFPIVIDGDIGEAGESEAYAELVLDKNFRGNDKDLAVLRDIPEIYSLSVHGAKLGEDALTHIATLPRLTTLNVRETAFSAAGLRKLRQQRPELTIICRSSAMLGINAGLEGPCVLTSVFFKSGAHDAGLRDGDEILEVDGQKVSDFSDLTIAVYPHKPGDKVRVKYLRNNDERTVEVLLKPRAAVEE